MNSTQQQLIDGLKQHIEQINNILVDCEKEGMEVTIAVANAEDMFEGPEPMIVNALALIKVSEVLLEEEVI